ARASRSRSQPQPTLVVFGSRRTSLLGTGRFWPSSWPCPLNPGSCCIGAERSGALGTPGTTSSGELQPFSECRCRLLDHWDQVCVPRAQLGPGHGSIRVIDDELADVVAAFVGNAAVAESSG